MGAVGRTILIVVGLTIVACLLVLLTEREKIDSSTFIGVVVVGTLAGVVGSYGIRFVRAGKRTRKRYRRRAPGDAEGALPTLRPLKDRLVGWPTVVFGFALCGLSGLSLLSYVAVYGSLPFTHEATPRWLAWMRAPGMFQSIRDHPFREAARTTLDIGVTIISGWILLRAGRRRLWPESYRLRLNDARVTVLDERAALRSAVLRLIGAVALFAVPVDGILVLRHCMEMQGGLPRWAVGALIYYDLEVACSNVVKSRWAGLDWGLGLFFFLSSILAVGLFFTGVRCLQRALGRRRRIGSAAGESAQFRKPS